MTRLKERMRDDSGTSLIELLVSMAILTIVSGIFTVAFISVQQSVRKQNSETDAQTSARSAFALFDQQVRYANALNDPTLVGGSQYVEWQSGDLGQNQKCFQWRAVNATGQLQVREWSFTVAAPTTAVPSNPSWRTVLGGLVTTGGAIFITPTTDVAGAFSKLGDTASPVERQLLVNFNITDGSTTGRGTTTVSSVFSAQNTTSGFAPTTPVCQQLGRP